MADWRSRALLFDMDGTLVDSHHLVERTWAEFADRHGLQIETILAFSHGRPTGATVREFLGDGDRARAETRRQVALEESCLDGVREVPGAARLLAALPADRWAVVTSANRTLAERRLTAAGLPMPDVLIGSDDVTRGKPDPEGFLRAAALLDAEITQCTVFEDSPAGLAAALASGARTVAVAAADPLGLPSVDDLTQLTVSFAPEGGSTPLTVSLPGARA